MAEQEKQFVMGLTKQYYEIFDKDRSKVADLFAPDAQVTYEQLNASGQLNIRDMLTNKLQVGTIVHNLASIESQPIQDGYIVVTDGSVKLDLNNPMPFHETLVLRRLNGGIYIQNAIFRMLLG